MAGSIRPSNSSSMRVLIRSPPRASTSIQSSSQTTRTNPSPPLPPSSSSTSLDSSKNPNPPLPSTAHPLRGSSPPAHSPPCGSPPPPPPRSSGVVVVGFIGRRESDVSQLINRLVDSDVFTSTSPQSCLSFGGSEDSEKVKDWFEKRRIKYYHDEEKGILYLQLCSTKCLGMMVGGDGKSDSDLGFDSVLEEFEFGDLQGMLFMFTVCHVIIYIQEGSRFEVGILKRFRVLQSAKQALAPFIRSRYTPSSLPRTSPSSSRLYSTSKSPSPGRLGAVSNRLTSGISVMSGLGSYATLFPGQCTPVTLFAFLDDFSDFATSTVNVENATDRSSSSQSSTLSHQSRSMKGPASVVVLARPVNKGEGGSKKKLQSSLETQIRFLIKKCRSLLGSDYSHGGGSRNGPVSSTLPLVTLDASRAVVLLDQSFNRSGESLDFACGLVNDVLNGEATSDSLLFERNSQSGSKEDISVLKEFIFRQADILRGRGGLVASGNSGSAGGVAMVAVAAAVAAASAASGKASNAPELPSLDDWLLSAQAILKGILTAKCGCIDENEPKRRKPRQKNVVSPQADGSLSRVGEPMDIAVSLLDVGKGTNMKFSTLWCQRTLPSAIDIYMKDLPDCYPTSQHEAHLRKALCAFRSMAKGPSVAQYMKKLEDHCTSVWTSGRQLCDAISLTGKPCVHQKHDVDNGSMPSSQVGESHRSGYVFLHACACGKSRQLRADPFDFETANITFNYFPACDKLIPGIQMPKVDERVNHSVTWFVVRLGGSKCYDPYKGLNQSGFCVNQKFLMKWTILIQNKKQTNGQFGTSAWNGSFKSVASDAKFELNTKVNSSMDDDDLFHSGKSVSAVESQRLNVDHIRTDDKKISFGNGLPNIPMKKPFSEVVAGSASGNLAFPPLQLKRQSTISTEKGTKKSSMKNVTQEQADVALDHNKCCHSPLDNKDSKIAVGNTDASFCLQIGSNVVPLNLNDSNITARFNPSVQHVSVYVGFEYECSHGHRFILSADLLNELGLPNSILEESLGPSSSETPYTKDRDYSSAGQTGGHIKAYESIKGSKVEMHKVINLDNSGQKEVDLCNPSVVEVSDFPKSSIKKYLMPLGVKEYGCSASLQQSLHSVKLDDGGQGFSLLNKNLPIYINCTYCRAHRTKKDRRSSAKFASMISQLQRIFVVTPPFPVVLSTNPTVHFQGSRQSLDGLNSERLLEFNLGSQVVLPPESFLSIRLPFVYSVQLENRGLCPLKPFEAQPELTAWIKQGTTLNLVSVGSRPD